MAYLRISWYWQMTTFSEQFLKASLLGLGHFGVPVYKNKADCYLANIDLANRNLG